MMVELGVEAGTPRGGGASPPPPPVWGVTAVDQLWVRPDGSEYTRERLYEVGRGVLPREVVAREVAESAA